MIFHEKSKKSEMRSQIYPRNAAVIILLPGEVPDKK